LKESRTDGWQDVAKDTSPNGLVLSRPGRVSDAVARFVSRARPTNDA
jgi:hypothetical protein